MDPKCKNILMQSTVIYLGNMSSESRMRTVRHFFRRTAQYAVDQLIGITGAIGGKDCAIDRGRAPIMSGGTVAPVPFVAGKRDTGKGYDQQERWRCPIG